MTIEKIEHLKAFFDSLEIEIGYPCIHRELKNYINDDNLRTWADVFKRYIDFPIVYPDFHIDEYSHCDSNDEENEHESEEKFWMKMTMNMTRHQKPKKRKTTVN